MRCVHLRAITTFKATQVIRANTYPSCTILDARNVGFSREGILVYKSMPSCYILLSQWGGVMQVDNTIHVCQSDPVLHILYTRKLTCWLDYCWRVSFCCHLWSSFVFRYSMHPIAVIIVQGRVQVQTAAWNDWSSRIWPIMARRLSIMLSASGTSAPYHSGWEWAPQCMYSIVSRLERAEEYIPVIFQICITTSPV